MAAKKSINVTLKSRKDVLNTKVVYAIKGLFGYSYRNILQEYLIGVMPLSSPRSHLLRACWSPSFWHVGLQEEKKTHGSLSMGSELGAIGLILAMHKSASWSTSPAGKSAQVRLDYPGRPWKEILIWIDFRYTMLYQTHLFKYILSFLYSHFSWRLFARRTQ